MKSDTTVIVVRMAMSSDRAGPSKKPLTTVGTGISREARGAVEDGFAVDIETMSLFGIAVAQGSGMT